MPYHIGVEAFKGINISIHGVSLEDPLSSAASQLSGEHGLIPEYGEQCA